jgi:hypothetical protein
MAAPGEAATQLAGLCVPHVPRALALMDRDVLSPTYGSMDRAYWYYRTLTNFPAAVWQQPMVGFAALACTTAPDNPFAGDATLLEAARAAMLAWTGAQHRNGAFDEWYRNEYSYCPTAITSAGAAATLDLLGGSLDSRSRDRGLDALRRAGRWLASRYNAGVMNQNLAAAVALCGLARLDGESRWRASAIELLQRIAADQSAEGWFPEYGGFDFGYSTLALDFLALMDRFGFSELADPMAERLLTCLTATLDAKRAVPGRLGSRGTAHVFPFGAIALSARLPAAGTLADVLLSVHAAGLGVGPGDADDRYFAYFAFPAFCLAYHAASRGVAPATHVRALPARLDLPQSGLALWRSADATVVVNHRLGGATALLREGTPALYHLGYTITTGGKRYSSATWRHLDVSATSENAGGHAVTLFSAVSGGLPLRWLTIPFQLLVHMLVVGRLAEAFQVFVKRRMIHPARTIPLTLERRVTVDGDTVRLDDRLRPTRSLPVDEVAVTSQPTMHSPSARQDRAMSIALGAEAGVEVRDALRNGRDVGVTWLLRVSTGQVESRVVE